jgi:hypothetical protein
MKKEEGKKEEGKKNIYHGVEEEVHGGHGGIQKKREKGRRKKGRGRPHAENAEAQRGDSHFFFL